MFDIGWTEILVIATVAIVVVGPKDLPSMLRTFGRTMGQVRRMSNDFKRQFDQALREAERESGLEETRKDLQAMSKVADPLKDARKGLSEAMRPLSTKSDGAAAKPKDAAKPADTATAAPEAKPAPSPKPDTATAGLHEAEPVKTAATGPGSSTA